MEVLVSQLAYISIALVEVLAAYLIMLRYRTQDWSGVAADSYYKPYETHVGGTNWWSMANMLNRYGKLAIYGVAFTTQILAIVGIVPDINMMVWQYGVIMGVSTLDVLYIVLNGLAYDTATNKCRQDEVALACGVADTMAEDFSVFFGLSSFSAATIFMNYPMWF